jgi:hemolysin III
LSREELANVFTHGAGVVAAILGGAGLIVLAALRADPWKIVGAGVFVLTLILLYSASTLYHLSSSPDTKRRLRKLDHAAIFLLIAGTYTPFTLVSLRGGWGWTLFGIVWGLAIAGVILKMVATGRLRVLSTALYLGMGWMILVAGGVLVHRLSPWILTWLFLGGLAYSAGTLFYHKRDWAYSHAVWHGFVLAGSACHAVAVWLQI